MDALPRRLPTGAQDALTGISCPECPGVLSVSAEHHNLRFECRIGHVFALVDLITVKEQRLEEALWAPVTALDELATLLQQAVSAAKLPQNSAYQERAVRALRHAEAIRAIIEENEPTRLDPDIRRVAD